MQIWIIVLQIFTLFVIGGLVLFGKYYLPSYFSEKGKNLATKEDIAGITREVESVKASFLEHQIRFSLFHQKQSDAISGMYELLHPTTQFVGRMVHPVQFWGDPPELQRLEEGVATFNKLADFYWTHKIYFPETVCEKVEMVLSTIGEAAINFSFARSNNTKPQNLALWYEAYQTMRDKVPQLREELETLLREILTGSIQKIGA